MRRVNVLVGGAAVLAAPAVAAAQQTLFSDNFDIDTSASYTVNQSSSSSNNAATFAFDYGAVGIPAAPGSTARRGLKLEANFADGVFSGISAAMTGRDFIAESPLGYRVSFYSWQNTVGPMPGGGSGSTQLATYGVGTTGNNVSWPGATDAVMFAVTGDGGSAQDYRAYTRGGAPLTPANGAYAAGTSPVPPATTPDSRNSADPYYASIGGAMPPPDQAALYPSQTGSAAPGAPAFAWHLISLLVTPTQVAWSMDNTLLATVNETTVGTPIDVAGTFFLGQSDVNSTSSVDPNVRDLLFTVYDNVTVESVPEPGTLGLLGLGCVGLLWRRRPPARSARPAARAVIPSWA